MHWSGYVWLQLWFMEINLWEYLLFYNNKAWGFSKPLVANCDSTSVVAGQPWNCCITRIASHALVPGSRTVRCCVVWFCVEPATVTPAPVHRRQCFYLIYFYFSVERRRRFNINDRIKELGDLIPKSTDPSVLSPAYLTSQHTLIVFFLCANGARLLIGSPGKPGGTKAPFLRPLLTTSASCRRSSSVCERWRSGSGVWRPPTTRFCCASRWGERRGLGECVGLGCVVEGSSLAGTRTKTRLCRVFSSILAF